ncbi:SOSS complex subunit C homolog B isoform X2 [Sabethes cyaneus]|uniref:SOSS complex subunit C homolog B isoform X2 n=1 Tax=Sabethes cyaneus TaxID=53552 RepID=UPI00237EDF0A|nr:SOSS complex subunit C homolog B isoform X2 [Sabethes cyaneus]
MAFPSSTDVTKKILEDIQIKKQLLQKGVSSVSSNITVTPAGLTIPQYIQATNQTQSTLTVETNINTATKAVWNQALNQSYGFFIPQDSLYGNSIIPVLPRFENTTPTNSSGSSNGSTVLSGSK